VLNVAIWGEVGPNPCGDMTKCRTWENMVDVITYAIFRDCRLKVVGEVRRVNLPSPIDLTCHPYNIGHTTV